MHDFLIALGDGAPSQQLNSLQVVVRAVIVFCASLVIVRVANKRFFGKMTAFDYLLGLILASMLARAINGSERIIPSLAAGFALALLHRGMAALAFHWPLFGSWIKGSSQTLIEEGIADCHTMSAHNIGRDDLLEELRLRGIEDVESVKQARLERSGEISVIKKQLSRQRSESNEVVGQPST